MCFVSAIDYIPKERLCAAIDIPLGFSCKCNRVSVYLWSAKHPYVTFFSYSGHASSLAVRHCKIHVGWVLRHQKRKGGRIYPMPLFNLSEVIWTEIRGNLCGSLQRDWVDVIRHVCNIFD
jgi:hypothetical protein